MEGQQGQQGLWYHRMRDWWKGGWKADSIEGKVAPTAVDQTNWGGCVNLLQFWQCGFWTGVYDWSPRG